MALVVGLDIGTKTVKGAVFSGNAKKFRLVDFFSEEIPAVVSGDYKEDGEYVAPLSVPELIDRALSERGLKTADVVAAVDSKDCVIREISVPFLKDEQIRKTVYFEAESHFTGFDLDGTVLEFVKVGEFHEKSQLILTALRDEVIEERLGLMKGAGVDPVALDLDAAALFNAYSLSPSFDANRSSLLIDMGATSTKILLVEKGSLRKFRSLRIETAVTSPARRIPEPVGVGAEGGEGREVSVEVVDGEEPPGFADVSIEERFLEIERALQLLEPQEPGSGQGVEEDTPIAILSDDEYDLVRRDPGEGELGDDPSAARDAVGAEPAGAAFESRFPGAERSGAGFDLRSYLERVAVEIQRSFAGVRLEAPIDLICLTGGLSSEEDARRYFTEEFDVETIQLDFGEAIETDLPPAEAGRVGAEGALAVGLALKELGADKVGIDFRKGQFRYEHKFERLKVPLLVLSLLAFVVCLQATFWAFHEYKLETRRRDGYRALSDAIYKEFFDEAPKGRALGSALQKKKQWEGKGAGDVGQFLDPAESLQDFSAVLNDSGMFFVIKSLDFKYRVSMRPARGGSGRSKALEPVAEQSKAVLWTEDSRGDITLQQLFRGDKSKFYSATAGDKKVSDDRYEVTLTLDVKDTKLAELTQ